MKNAKSQKSSSRNLANKKSTDDNEPIKSVEPSSKSDHANKRSDDAIDDDSSEFNTDDNEPLVPLECKCPDTEQDERLKARRALEKRERRKQQLQTEILKER